MNGDVSKVGYFLDIAISIADSEFKIKSLYSNDLILNIASKSKETVQKLKFLNSPVQRQVFLTKNLLLCGTTDVLVGNDTLSVFSSGTDAARIKQKQV